MAQTIQTNLDGKGNVVAKGRHPVTRELLTYTCPRTWQTTLLEDDYRRAAGALAYQLGYTKRFIGGPMPDASTDGWLWVHEPDATPVYPTRP